MFIIKPKSHFINLGCGSTFHLSWDNFDLQPASDNVRYVDLLGTLPFDQGVYKYCYNSHVLEHLPRQEAPKFLNEINRILEPDGVLRIVVPDLEGIARRYLDEIDAVDAGDVNALNNHEWMTIELLDQLTRTFSGGFMGRLWYSRPLPARALIEERLGKEATRWLSLFDEMFFNAKQEPLFPHQVFQHEKISSKDEIDFRDQGEIHRWMYDRISLKTLLENAGFHKVRVCTATESLIPDFKQYNLDTDEVGKIRKPDSLFMEAIK